MTEETTTEASGQAAQSAPAPPASAETSAGGIVGQAAAGTTAQGALGGAIAGAATAPTIEAQIANLDQRVTRLETPKPGVATQSQQPSKGRVVIFRDAVGNESAAMITGVRTTGVDLQVFRNDAGPMTVNNQLQIIDPLQAGEMGWFWPPRV